MTAIVFDGVRKTYGAVTALRDVSFEIRRGEMFGLIGPDGAGKTTAIRAACGLIRVDAGRVQVLGHDPVRAHRQVAGAVGYLSQRFTLYGDLTIDENIAFFAEIHRLRRFQAARDRLLEMTRLTPFRGRRADRLSGGMKQKLALACTLVHEPQVLLLDEPTTGVDPVSRREFWKLLAQFLAEGLTIVMATPYLDEAERCARVALLHDGRLLAADEPDRLRAGLRGQMLEVVTRTARPPIDRLAAMAGVLDAQTFGDRAHVRLRSGEDGAAVRAFADELARAGIDAVSIRPVPVSLEDVFIDLIGQGRGPEVPA
jgi:ABC-2 type transport system ATP-binding protein